MLTPCSTEAGPEKFNPWNLYPTSFFPGMEVLPMRDTIFVGMKPTNEHFNQLRNLAFSLWHCGQKLLQGYSSNAALASSNIAKISSWHFS